jgi:hypothetical protein
VDAVLVRKRHLAIIGISTACIYIYSANLRQFALQISGETVNVPVHPRFPKGLDGPQPRNVDEFMRVRTACVRAVCTCGMGSGDSWRMMPVGVCGILI